MYPYIVFIYFTIKYEKKNGIIYILHVYLFNMKYFEHNFNVKIIQSEYSELDQSWKMNNTIDPFIRLYYIAGGRGRVLCGKQNIALEQDKLYLLPSQTSLTFWTTGYLNIYWAHVQLMLAPGIDIFNVINGKVMCIPEPEISVIERFKVLGSEKLETLSGDLRSQALVMELVAYFFQRYNIELPDKFEKDLKRFESVIAMVEKSTGKRWNIPELARRAGLGRVQFSTEFKRVFGMPPAKFIMSKRLEQARYLLLNSKHTLEYIAADLGFSDAFHFSKSFKSGIGISPKEFRTQHKTILP